MSDLISINPANGDIVGVYPQLTEIEINEIIVDVEKEFHLWRKFSKKERCQYFKNLKDAMLIRKDELAHLMALEMGKPLSQGIGEIEKCAWVCDYYSENGEDFLKNKLIDTEASESYISFQPLGIIFGVMPWNFPFWQVFRFAVPTMIAGNVVLLKHSSNVQGCAFAIESLFLEAGFPKYAFSIGVISTPGKDATLQKYVILVKLVVPDNGSAVIENSNKLERAPPEASAVFNLARLKVAAVAICYSPNIKLCFNYLYQTAPATSENDTPLLTATKLS